MALETHLGGNLPNGSENGLEAITQELLKNPDVPRYAIVKFDVQSISRKIRKGTTEPTIGIRNIEPITPGTAMEKDTQDLLETLYIQRTGESSLPKDGDPTATELDIEDPDAA